MLFDEMVPAEVASSESRCSRQAASFWQARRAAWMDESALPGLGAALTHRAQGAVPTDGKQEQGQSSAQFGWNTDEVKG